MRKQIVILLVIVALCALAAVPATASGGYVEGGAEQAVLSWGTTTCQAVTLPTRGPTMRPAPIIGARRSWFRSATKQTGFGIRGQRKWPATSSLTTGLVQTIQVASTAASTRVPGAPLSTATRSNRNA
jgi:hypothetical protein